MRNILSADLARLRRDPLFRLCCAGIAVTALLFLYFSAAARAHEAEVTFEKNLFNVAPLIGFVLAFFCSLFLGTDASDGTIRNKLICGGTRNAVCLSGLITCCIAAESLLLVFLLFYVPAGLWLFGKPQMPAGQLALYFTACFLTTLSYASLFAMLAMLIQSRSRSLAVCVAGILLLFFLCSYLITLLNEPEIIRPFVLENGRPIFSDPVENPEYIRGVRRVLYQFVTDFLPMGQSIRLSNLEAEHLPFMLLYSAASGVLSTAAALLLFRKKDLK